MIEISNLKKSYKKLQVLNIDSLKFERGKSYGLVGPNGSGKTTLFKCITNIICDYTGSIKISDIVVKENNSILQNVGIVLDGMSVYANRTGQFNIDYFSGLRGIENNEKAHRIADELGILDVLDKKVKKYSYGMQKKLILLIALLFEPKLLILDEPFRGLDIDTVQWFKVRLKELTKSGLTLIISSHVQKDIEQLCEEVYFLNSGEITNHINLQDEKKATLRLIETSDNKKFIDLLEYNRITYEVVKDNKVKVDIGDSNWGELLASLEKQKIELLEMQRESVLEKGMESAIYDK